MTNDRCPDCGAMYALVGHRHRCIPTISSDGVEKAPDQRPSLQGENTSATREAVVARRTERSDASPSDSKAMYAHRDADKWRLYMRDYMRKRRGKDQEIKT